MPRTIIFSNVILLLCLSLLAGSGVMFLIAGSGEFRFDMDTVGVINLVALVTAFVMLLTEMFSGIWIAPLVAVGALAVATWVIHDAETADTTAVFAWAVAFVAVVGWFTYLVGVGRQSQ